MASLLDTRKTSEEEESVPTWLTAVLVGVIVLIVLFSILALLYFKGPPSLQKRMRDMEKMLNIGDRGVTVPA